LGTKIQSQAADREETKHVVTRSVDRCKAVLKQINDSEQISDHMKAQSKGAIMTHELRSALCKMYIQGPALSFKQCGTFRLHPDHKPKQLMMEYLGHLEPSADSAPKRSGSAEEGEIPVLPRAIDKAMREMGLHFQSGFGGSRNDIFAALAHQCYDRVQDDTIHDLRFALRQQATIDWNSYLRDLQCFSKGLSFNEFQRQLDPHDKTQFDHRLNLVCIQLFVNHWGKPVNIWRKKDFDTAPPRPWMQASPSEHVSERAHNLFYDPQTVPLSFTCLRVEKKVKPAVRLPVAVAESHRIHIILDTNIFMHFSDLIDLLLRQPNVKPHITMIQPRAAYNELDGLRKKPATRKEAKAGIERWIMALKENPDRKHVMNQHEGRRVEVGTHQFFLSQLHNEQDQGLKNDKSMLLYGEELRKKGHLATWLSNDVSTWSMAEGSEPRVAACKPEELRQILQADPQPTIPELREALGWPESGSPGGDGGDGGGSRKRKRG